MMKESTVIYTTVSVLPFPVSSHPPFYLGRRTCSKINLSINGLFKHLLIYSANILKMTICVGILGTTVQQWEK